MWKQLVMTFPVQLRIISVNVFNIPETISTDKQHSGFQYSNFSKTVHNISFLMVTNKIELFISFSIESQINNFQTAHEKLPTS